MGLNSPIMIASGNFGIDGYGLGQADYSLNVLGGVVMKTLTRYLKQGNEFPCQFPDRFKDGIKQGQILLNSYGLNNPGIEFAAKYLFSEWSRLDTDIIISIAGYNEQEWTDMAKIIDNNSIFKAIELNLSCPNINHNALFDYGCETFAIIESVIATVRSYNELPIWVKLPPNISNIIEVAQISVDAGANALTIANTIPALHIDIKTGKSVLANIYGGMSGPALKPINMALVHKINQNIDIPIIGVGGIVSGADVMEYIMAGASAVQIGSANSADFNSPFNILLEYNQLCCNLELN